MFFEDVAGSFPPPGRDRFYIGEVFSLDQEPDPDLLVQIGWKSEQYDFAFYEAFVVEDGFPTSSWVEFAFSRQLGGAFVLWRSGITAMEAPRSISYGWVEGSKVESMPDLIAAKAQTRGPQLFGCHFDTTNAHKKRCYA